MASSLCFFSYSFFWGGWLRWNEKTDIEGNLFNGGTCLSIILCLLFGTQGFSAAAPHLIALSEGKAAGTLAFEVIDHVPKILPNEENTKILKREEVKGEITFKNVSFSYPSDKNLKVLKNFSLTFKKGTTTAFVGPSGSGKSTII